MFGMRKKKSRKWIAIVAGMLGVAILATGGIFWMQHAKQKREAAEWRAMMDAYYNAKVASYVTENEQYEDYEVDVAFIGDSLTDGYDVKHYYPQYTVVNRGIGGDTTVGLEKRLQVSLYDLKPKVVVMLIGVNNIHSMFDNYERILQGFEENLPDTKIILVSLTSMSGEWGRNNHLAAYNNVRIKMLAEEYGYSFVDLYAPLMNPETGEIYDKYTTDGGHLTPAGYEVFTAQVTPAIDAYLR